MSQDLGRRARGDERLRITIGGKVFGIALLLVVLMGVAAAISSYLVRDAAFAITRVNQTYMPLSQAIAEIALHQLEQELIALELFGDLENPDLDQAAIERRLTRLKDRGARVDEALARARQVLASASEDPRYADDLAGLVRLEALIATLDREHHDFERQSLRIVEVSQVGSGEISRILLDDWRRQEEEFNAELAEAIGTISGYAATAGEDAQAAERGVHRTNVALTAIAAVAGLLLAAAIVRSLVRPVHDLVSATEEVERGNLQTEIAIRTRDEIGQLARSFNHMLAEMRVKERIKDTFGRYVDPRIVESLLGNPDTLEREGERQDCTVYFSDIAGFTGLAELLTPAAVLRVINSYFTLMSEPIRDNQGIIDKYIGDAIMAFWVPPFTEREDHARLACLSALDQRERLAAFQARLPQLTGLRHGVPAIQMRIGIATGEVVVGNVGSEVSKNYTVIGDTVNLAARLEALNKQYGTGILIAGATEALAQGAIEAREIDLVAVAGKSEPIRIFELLAARGGLSPEAIERRDRFEAALAAYRERDWPAARAGFEACLQGPDGDPPAQVFLERLDHLAADPPGEDWDGVWRPATK
jgi:class 3 adenylate cyclase